MSDNETVFCASDCKNFNCYKMLSYSIVRMAERTERGEPLYEDLSENCERYTTVEIKVIGE